ncbi:MAG TPA: PocR ligand-binding domain-containing protein [Armatimonadota bacterium]|jgi:AraC-like DNA-binding protein
MAQTLSALLKPEVQRIFDHFSTCFNARIVFLNAAGELVTACRNRPDSPYCQLLRERFGEETCNASDRNNCIEAARQQRMLCYQCHAGLVEATKPIVYCGRILGFVTIGQLRTQAAMPPAIRDAWSAQYALTELEASYTALPMMTTEQIDALLDLFSIFVDYIISQQMIVLATHRDLEIILNFMEAHATESPTLADVADLIQKKPSTVSHLFAQHLGQSFKRTLLEIKLRRADEYMRQHPEETIAAAACASGFTDPLYFSRLYKQYRHVSPSQFLAQCRSLL